MSNRFITLSQRVVVGMCATAALTGFNACSDSYDLDEQGNNPSWLGKSIYEELENPQGSNLKGTFQTYLRLIDDLGYKEVMSKTGSKTIFVANDSAYTEFFKNNSWGVKSYEQLTESMKKQLFYASMLDNAILTEALSNVDNGGETTSRGIALKHQTAANATDSIYMLSQDGLPQNNSYWNRYADKGIHLVMDNTRPMLIHFTREQMLNNSITGADFQVLTGQTYDDQSTFIFKNKILVKDITCLNGYINQMDGVVVPPGNLAKIIREGSDTQLFRRMMDRFCAPYYDATTTVNYNDNAIANGGTPIDSIFQLRYFSERSQGATPLTKDPQDVTVSNDRLLRFDPGWNQYYSTYGNSLADVGAMFVPNDDAIRNYFLNPSSGGYQIISLYNKKPNTLENLYENIDSIPDNIISSFVNNMMNASFVQSVPSKFGTILDEASDPIGLTTDDIVTGEDGKKDVRIANNGVMYMLNEVIPPVSYNVVSTPALLRDNRDLGVINWAIQSKQTSGLTDASEYLNVNYYAYLRASTANYAMFLPDNEAFDAYYIDPVSLGKNKKGGSPRVLHFYKKTKSPYLGVSAFEYDPETGIIANDSSQISKVSTVHDRLIDILNYHTVSLSQGTVFGGNKYYKTKHGGEIAITGNTVDSEVMGGAQIVGKNGNSILFPASKIKEVSDNYSNGSSFIIDHVIQAPLNSVYGCLKNNGQFSKFLELCETPGDMDDILKWVGITKEKDKNQFYVFTDKFSSGSDDCLDMNISFFNNYNYTVYAPNNDAMDEAYELGLPSWEDVRTLMKNSPGEASKGLAMIETIRNFIRYHFQDVSIYADKTLDYGDAPTEAGGRSFNTSCNYNDVYQKLILSGGNGVIHIKAAGNTATVKSGIDGKVVNFMARDYEFKSGAIQSSSFAVVHEIDTPLCYSTSGSYGEWKNNSAFAKMQRALHRQAMRAAQSAGVQFYK